MKSHRQAQPGVHRHRQPDCIGAAVLRVPFVDVLTAMTRPDLPLTEHEYDEWGDVRANPDALRTVSAVVC